MGVRLSFVNVLSSAWRLCGPSSLWLLRRLRSLISVLDSVCSILFEMWWLPI